MDIDYDVEKHNAAFEQRRELYTQAEKDAIVEPVHDEPLSELGLPCYSGPVTAPPGHAVTPEPPSEPKIIFRNENYFAAQARTYPTGIDFEDMTPAQRKQVPVITGVLDYFPDAIASVAIVSMIGNDQHNPGEPLHWAREKSTDEINTAGRHLMQRGTRDTDGARHLAKAAWRILAALQKEIEADGNKL